MLLLIFQVGGDRYALDCAGVVEVLPLLDWKQVPRAADGILGVFSYHGVMVPLLDLSQMMLGRPARLLMSTRIVLVDSFNSEGQPAGENRLLGLLAEEATGTLRRGREEFEDSGVAVGGAPYLGPVTSDDGGIVQLVAVERLLAPGVREQLFRAIDELAAGETDLSVEVGSAAEVGVHG